MVECIHPGLNVIVIRVTRTVRRWTGSYRSVTGPARLQRLRKVRLLRRVQFHRNNFCRSAPVLSVTMQLSIKEFLTSEPFGSSRNATPLSSKLGSTFGLQ